MIFEPKKINHNRFWHYYYALKSLRKISGRVLDIGCGRGEITTAIQKQRPDLDIYAGDKNKDYLSCLEKNKFLIKVFQADINKLPFKDNFFNAVLVLDVLEHLKKPEQALKEIKRVLIKDGIFYLVIPIEASLATFDGWFKKSFGINLKKKPIGHIQQFNRNDIKKLLNKAGFKILSIYYSHHLIYQLYSLTYYLYLAVFNKSRYIKLNLDMPKTNNLLINFVKLNNILSNFESMILKSFPGQTAHITSVLKK